MKKSVLYIAAIAMMSNGIGGCVNVDPPLTCYNNSDTICDVYEVSPLGDGDLVCNEAVTLVDACAELMETLPPGIPVPDICQGMPDLLATCQLIGAAGDPCAEGPDCESGSCTGEVCD